MQKSLAKMVEPVMMEKMDTLVIVHLDMKDLTVKQVIVRMIPANIVIIVLIPSGFI